ncbi:DUF6463 family protein [Kitasatospora sp. NPDC056446]|uniref:DUF6463 family protein n=1 Tax=Kitasatospora sp. NPDC056446 TaxID=3345819 RepID=UPI00368CA817
MTHQTYRLTRAQLWVPRLLLATAALHVAVAAAVPNAWGAIARAGFFDVLGGHDDRQLALYFGILALPLAMAGTTARWMLRTTGRIPAQLGWWLIAMGAPIAVLDPVSGAWLLLGIGWLAVAAGRRPARVDVGTARPQVAADVA